MLLRAAVRGVLFLGCPPSFEIILEDLGPSKMLVIHIQGTVQVLQVSRRSLLYSILIEVRWTPHRIKRTSLEYGINLHEAQPPVQVCVIPRKATLYHE